MYVSENKNEHGVTHNFQVLDERQLKYILKLAEENIKMPVRKYNGKCYLKIIDKGYINMI